MIKRVYFDNAATTQVSPEVLSEMTPYFSQIYGNASEPHSWGDEAKKGINQAREQVADVLGAKPSEIFFTSCATESINLAHKGLIEAARGEGRGASEKPHIITTQIEHKAVLETCKHLEKLGLAEVTYLPVDQYGLVSIGDVEKAIKENTVLVSVMYVNNEVGTIEPIVEIGKMIKEVNITRLAPRLPCKGLPLLKFHTDATQAIQYMDCNVDTLGVDMLSMTGHKLHAPKGIGALYIRKGMSMVRQQDGGAQELGLRAGTENVPYIVGLGKAIELARSGKWEDRSEKIERLRDKLIAGILKITGTKLTGHSEKRAPHIASFVFEGIEGEAMLLYLSEEGIAVSSGSACTSGSLEPSHVLTAMGIPPEIAHGSVRFSLSKYTTEDEIEYTLKVLPGVVKRIRKMAPKL